MADQTRVDVGAVTASADAVGALLPPSSGSRDRLGADWSPSGPFAAAQQLDGVSDARAQELLSYVTALRTELGEFGGSLAATARNLVDTDVVSGTRVTDLPGDEVVDA
ncbi:hypothetical protein [Pseudonocardia sp. ICBG162]|uniref:hypothetical protein n=1 Tax=Pseudonocardia sp. ICBG162 TaxID=2846761 RepID=UPI001CF69A51|nr:hypothetical protein [Pseudonocardia sp. ICBG162]